MFRNAPPSLKTINAQRAQMGLPPLEVNPVAMRPGKTAKQNKKAQNANRAAHAAKQAEIREARRSGRKGK